MSVNNRVAWSGGGRRIGKTTDERRVALLPGRWRDLAEGRIDPGDLDDEEVFTGRLRKEDGSLGPRPRVLPSILEDERTKRALHKGNDRFKMFYERACATICEIASDPNQAASDRLKAAGMIMDRVAGKTPERLVVAAEDPFVSLYRDILRDPEGLMEPVDVPKEPAGRDL